ncbi:L domain-like protein [Piromyces finnis]|uniref:L domain-like protein n=1 Tax=Piromyces finnis TaxID=1754191 RepID=A0A1Y1V8E8_9FUNG|nr:L domain-like protein [Piromyces finnis]|eukprot:ORX49622.1 L domain-like protein [Piromyces finnis]
MPSKYLYFILANIFLFGLNIQNVLANDCEILTNALTNFSSNLKTQIGGAKNCCWQKGVACNSEKQIVSLEFTDSYSVLGNKGIPSEIGNLLNLEKLNLSYNSMNGELPSSIGKLKNLKFLNLKDNHFEGYIPYEYKNLENLETLYVFFL